jgi:H+-translocating NAD(P) transhydrogenase subunit alpha
VKIGCLRETFDKEARVALTPASAVALAKLGHECVIEADAGLAARFSDATYRDAGVGVLANAAEVIEASDGIVKVNPPTPEEVAQMRSGQTVIALFYPAQNEALLAQCAEAGVSVIAMDMVPRISRAQKMDALSSMANIAGYRAVIEAGSHFGRFFTGQITAAGKVPPAKVLVIGAGVAGLAAIGAAKSLGAIVRAFDVRPEVAEQIESMGADFLFLDFEEDGSGDGGYAAPSSPEFREKQLECFREQAPEVDIVVTTALIPGRPAPRLWLDDMVALMKPGSVVVDLAAERGGNCDLTKAGEIVTTDNAVTVVGYTDFPSRMAAQSSELYATNIRHMVHDLTPGKDGVVVHDMNDEVIRGSTVAHASEITFPPPARPSRPMPVAAAQRDIPVVVDPVAAELAASRQAGTRQIMLLVLGAALMAVMGVYAPASFMQHFIVFVLGCFIGFQVIWNVSHALHTPLMSVTNAISGIIILGALLQIDSPNGIVTGLAAVSVLIATINIVGGFMVTRRMLQMFQRS